jgi:hypothetical protein
MNYTGDDIVHFNGCMRRYSPLQMKTGETVREIKTRF